MSASPPDPSSVSPRVLHAPGNRAQPPGRNSVLASWRNTIITVALAGLAAFLGAHLGSRRVAPPPVPLSERVYEVLNESMDLTDQQRSAIRSIGARYTPEREKLRTQSRALNVRIARLMAEEQSFGPKTSAALDELQFVMGERLKLSLQYMLEVRAVLTPEQREFFDRRVAEEASMSR